MFVINIFLLAHLYGENCLFRFIPVQKVTDWTLDVKIKWAQNEVWLIMQNALII